MDHVVTSLADLNDFIERADEGLMTQVAEGDYDGLIKVMEFLQVNVYIYVIRNERVLKLMFNIINVSCSFLTKIRW